MIISGGMLGIPGGGFEPSGGFNGNFASLFTGVLQSVQTDLGLTYGGTMLAAGTAPPVITLTGSLAGPPVAIHVIAGSPGVVGSTAVFGATAGGVFQGGIFPSVGVPVALTGPATGLFLTVAAGTSSLDNTWDATCAGLADQVGANHYTQATASKQPVVATGLNGFASIVFDGIDDRLTSALNLPVPGTSPWFVWYVFRQVTWINQGIYLSSNSDASTGDVLVSTSPTIFLFNGASAASNGGAAIGTFVRGESYFANSVADYLKLGTTSSGGSTAGNNSATGRTIGSSGLNTRFGNMELLALVYMSSLPSVGQLAAASAAVTAKYGASVVV